MIFLGTVPSTAQSRHTGDPVFAKLGVGFSDYTGDFPIQSFGHPLDFQEFRRGSGFPFTFNGEVGYQFSSHLALTLGVQGGNYPIVGYGGGSIQDSYRYTPQLLARYTFGGSTQSVKPYVDGGLNVTFGGDTGVGVGPSVGAGIDIPIDRSLSFYVESRLNFTLPDGAIDGTSDLGDHPSEVTDKTNNPRGSITGPFDSVNQLFGFGLKFDFGEPSENASSPQPANPPTLSDSVESDSVEKATEEAPRPDTSRFEESVLIPSGSFIMGLTDEDPLSLQSAGRKRVTVSSFFIEQYEVSNAEYREYLSQLSPDQRRERLPDSTAWSKARTQESWEAYFRSDYYADYPVVAVTWNEARAYCEAQDKRLPTEAEWEYAARAGHLGRVYPWEGLSTLDQDGDYRANFNPPEGYANDGYAFTAPVDAFPPNDWGLYNVAGNVAEWIRDAYTPSYDNLSDFNPHYTDKDEPRRVIRGGAWNSNASFIGVGMRDTQPKEEASADIGFRCARGAVRLDRKPSPRDTTENGNTQE